MLKGLEAGVLIRLLELVNSYWSSITHRYAMFLSMSLRERLEVVLSDLEDVLESAKRAEFCLHPNLPRKSWRK
jgi:hypothetical protein